MSRSRHNESGDVHRQSAEVSENMFSNEPELIGPESDLKKIFVRILEQDDWTDKLASGLGKIRTRVRRPHKDTGLSKEHRKDTRPSEKPSQDTKLSKELQLLVPDMREVEKAYIEMTSGYKDFIRDVLKASRQRQER